ncbi:unnamed protein product [Withania somnifera]
MDCLSSLLYSKNSLTQFPSLKFNNTLLPTPLFCSFNKKKTLTLVASCRSSNNNEYSGLTMPLVPTTEAGKTLSGILLNDVEEFYDCAEKELVKLACLKNDALLRSVFSLCSDEAVLHRRISELIKLECRKAVEDVMYMLIVYKFSEIGVHLVPKLSSCMYNGRLEIWPRKDWELESIHSVEVLEMVKEIGWEYKSNVKDNWALTQVQKLQIRHVYTASVLYGYFLKSASLRYHLEQKSVLFGCVSDTGPISVGPMSLIEGKRQDNLKSYVLSLDHEVKDMCAKPKFKEAMNVIEKHCSALFGVDSDEKVSTSFASLKRLVLEAVAFGSFLWGAEDYVRAFYRLEEN